ncbi:Serine/arginine-rich splicing factor RS31 [Glycine soja]
MRPIFAGNLEYDTRQSELERLFAKYGRIDRVDMKSVSDLNFGFKPLIAIMILFLIQRLYSFMCISPHLYSGFAFVYYEDERDAEEAIRALDNVPFGHEKRRLSVEWARGERGRHHDGSKANQKPTKTLFVINFDPIRTRVRDIEKHFEPYGNVLHVRIRRNFAFVQFETQEDATKALECTNMSKILDRVVSVEYALRDDGERGDNYDSPRRRGGYERSPSPYHRRPSPDYGRPRSPVYDRYNGGGPDMRRSPDYGRHRSPDYGRRRSPDYGKPRSPEYGRYRSRSRSPVRRSRT